jgi:hypothetical protein
MRGERSAASFGCLKRSPFAVDVLHGATKCCVKRSMSTIGVRRSSAEQRHERGLALALRAAAARPRGAEGWPCILRFLRRLRFKGTKPRPRSSAPSPAPRWPPAPSSPRTAARSRCALFGAPPSSASRPQPPPRADPLVPKQAIAGHRRLCGPTLPRADSSWFHRRCRRRWVEPQLR